MTMIPGKDGITMDNIDLTHAKDIICEKCGGLGFRQTMMLKKLSPLMSPNGQEAIIPVAAFACDSSSRLATVFLRRVIGTRSSWRLP